MIVDAACSCSTGIKRDNNEDNFYFCGKTLPVDNNGLNEVLFRRIDTRKKPLLAAFDGMGGESAGEIASKVSAEKMKHYDTFQKERMNTNDFFNQACIEMNREVCSETKKRSLKRMGSTVASVMFFGEKAFACNIGDSRIYLFRKDKLSQISIDHVEKLPPDSRYKAGLTQFLGIPENEMRLVPFVCDFELQKDDKILICTDGVTDMLSDSEILAIMKYRKSTKKIVSSLISLACQKGGIDNITAIVCKVK